MRDNIALNQKRYKNSPRGKYISHKINAKQRGIPFDLSFDQWMNIWQASGMWDQRGNRTHQFVMMRIDDIGAYKVGNVFIGEFRRNLLDGNPKIKKKHTKKTTTVTFTDATHSFV